MYPRTRINVMAAATVVALVLTGCATLRVNSYLERGADFARYRSYAWSPREALSTGDPRLDNNRFFSQRVEDAVDTQLAARGYEKATAGTADLLIHIHARVDQRIDGGAIDREYRRCDAEDCRPQVYDAGTLLVDLLDRRTNRLAWRGWAECSFDGVIDDQHWMEETIDKAVARILARLPRSPW
jgi:hypothetical protein